jgi:hypothetical protein
MPLAQLPTKGNDELKLLAILLLLASPAYAATIDTEGSIGSGGGGGFGGTMSSDLEMGNTPYSIDGGTGGLAFDPDNDDVNEVTIGTDGSISLSGSSSISSGAGGLDFTASNVIYVGISDTLSTVITNATAGDTLVLAAGTYTLPSTLTINKALTIIGQGYDSTIITGAFDSLAVIKGTASNIRINQLTAINTSSAAASTQVFLFDGTAGTVLTGIVLDRVKATFSSAGAGGHNPFEFQDASGSMVDCISSATASAGPSNGILLQANSTNEAAITLDIYNSSVSVSGTSGNTSGIISNANSAANPPTINVYGGNYVSTVSGGNGYGLRANGTSAVLNVFGSPKVSGTTADLAPTSSGTVNNYSATLVNNSTAAAVTALGNHWVGDLTVNGSDITLGTAGVKLSGDGDGALEILGLSAGSDECLSINVDDTANTAELTNCASSSALSALKISGMALSLDIGTGVGQATLDGSTGGCLMLRDTDDAGWTECDALDGTLSCSTDADGICD